MNAVRAFVSRHPALASWAGMAVAMVAILLLSTRGAALTPLQRLWLVIATIGLAGACAWIIHLE